MRGLGITLLLFGLLSMAFVLFRLPLQFLPLIWIDSWGMTVGWCIRAALVLVGAVLVVWSFVRRS